jgi:hypothetical protein
MTPQEEPFRHQPDPPPLETPGPSVPPPALPESEAERRERGDDRRPDAEATGARDPDEQLVADEESAAAAEAASCRTTPATRRWTPSTRPAAASRTAGRPPSAI